MSRSKSFTKEQFLTAIASFIAKHGMPPTIAELKKKLNIGSNRTVLRYLAWLEEEGDVERWSGARGLRLRRAATGGLETNAVPVLGTAPAGPVTLAEENWEGVVRVPKSLLSPSSARFFLLRVRGDSMNKATVHGDRIEDGDLVLVRQQNSADTGNIVVALVDGEATIKRFAREKGYVALKPESSNRNHRPIIAGSNLRVQGVVCRVIKSGADLMEF